MKTHYAVLVLFSFVLLTNLSCKDDDNDVIIEEEIVVLTGDNNLYEGDLYLTYLETQTALLEEEINTYEEIINNNQGNAELMTNLAIARDSLSSLNDSSNTQTIKGNSLASLNVFRVPRIPPLPPQPCLFGACIPNDLSFLSITDDILSLNVIIKNAQTGKAITTITIGQFSPLPQYNDSVSATPINIQDYTGDVIFDIQRSTDNGNINYSLMGSLF